MKAEQREELHEEGLLEDNQSGPFKAYGFKFLLLFFYYSNINYNKLEQFI